MRTLIAAVLLSVLSASLWAGASAQSNAPNLTPVTPTIAPRKTIVIKHGTSIYTTLSDPIIPAKLRENDLIFLAVVAPYPQGDAALQGATITAHITDTSHGKIGFLFDFVVFSNGNQQPFAAFVQNSRITRRTEKNSPANTVAANQTLPQNYPGPVNQPVLWQANLTGPATGVNPGQSGSTGGYAYPRDPNRTIPVGTPVELQLAQDLSAPG